jgi:hypothetical protein
MKATMVKELHFYVTNGHVTVAVDLDGEGHATFLSHAIGKRAPHEFSGDEITTTPSDEGTRATVVLDNGQADRPIVRFTVIVPEVIPGDESSYDVGAAALQSTEHVGFARPRPGPQHTYETFELKGKVEVGEKAGGYEAGNCHDWSAIHDLMPGHPSKLIVTGTCTFPTTGYEVELRPSVPQGINPLDLLLDKVVTPPTGIVAQHVTDVEARYEEVTDVMYETVTIEGGPSIKVENAL